VAQNILQVGPSAGPDTLHHETANQPQEPANKVQIQTLNVSTVTTLIQYNQLIHYDQIQ